MPEQNGEATHVHPIQVVARRTGLTPHAIRIWEKRYEAVVPHRTPTNRRLYSDADIERLFLLRKATLGGRSIGQVAGMDTDALRDLVLEDDAALPPGSTATVPTHEDPSGFFEASLNAVQNMDSKKLQNTLARASTSMSQPVLVEQVIVPLLKRLGDMWQNGEVRIAHEHLASAVVRSFLGNLERAAQPPTSAPSAVFATPRGQHHELGALMAAVLAASDGWRVVYLGPSLPAEEITGAAHKSNARVVALSLVYPSDDPDIPDELRRVQQFLPEGASLVVGGRVAASYSDALASIGATAVSDLADFRTQMAALRA